MEHALAVLRLFKQRMRLYWDELNCPQHTGVHGDQPDHPGASAACSLHHSHWPHGSRRPGQ